MFCPNCGTELAEGAVFCPSCGNPVAQDAAAQTADEAVTSAFDDAAEPVRPPLPAEDAAEAVAEAATPEAAAPETVAPEAVAPEPFVPEPVTMPAAEAATGAQPATQPSRAPAPEPEPAQPTEPYAAAQPYAAPQPADPYASSQPYAPAQPTQPYTAAPVGSPYAGYTQPAYGAPQPQKTSGVAVAALVLGILGFLGGLLPIVGWFAAPLMLAGIICGIIGIVTVNKNGKKGKGLAIAGLVLSILAVIVTIVWTVLTGLVVQQAAEGDPEFVERLEQLEQLIEDPEGTIDLELDGNDVTLDLSTGTTEPEPTAPATTGSWDSECTDARGNITLYAISELDGAELAQLLDEQTYDEILGTWISDDNGYFAAMDAEQVEFDSDTLPALSAGGAGQPVIYYLSQDGYDSLAAALQGTCPMVVQDSELVSDDELYAIAYGPSMRQFFIMGSVDETDGNHNFYIFNNEAITSGLFGEIIGSDITSFDEAWRAATNRGMR